MDLFATEGTLAGPCGVCGVDVARGAGVACPVCEMPGSVDRCQGLQCRAALRAVHGLQAEALLYLDIGVVADGGVVLEWSPLAGWRGRRLLEWERAKWGPVRWREHADVCPHPELYRR